MLYNLETAEHVYRVGTLGQLVHNGCAKVPVRELFGRQLRSKFTPSTIRKLKNSMKQHGFDETKPIRIAIVDGRKIILDGHHRARAAGAVGIREVPVIIEEVTPAQGRVLLQQAAEAAENLGLSARWFIP